VQGRGRAQALGNGHSTIVLSFTVSCLSSHFHQVSVAGDGTVLDAVSEHGRQLVGLTEVIQLSSNMLGFHAVRVVPYDLVSKLGNMSPYF
jgi:hypothetical protein